MMNIYYVSTDLHESIIVIAQSEEDAKSVVIGGEEYLREFGTPGNIRTIKQFDLSTNMPCGIVWYVR